MDVNQLCFNSKWTEGGRTRRQDTNSAEHWDQLQPAGHTSMSTKKCYLIFAKHCSNSSQGISGPITSEIARWRLTGCIMFPVQCPKQETKLSGPCRQGTDSLPVVGAFPCWSYSATRFRKSFASTFVCTKDTAKRGQCQPVRIQLMWESDQMYAAAFILSRARIRQNYCESPTESGRGWLLFKHRDKLAMNCSLLEGASKNICSPLQTFFKGTPGFLPAQSGTSRRRSCGRQNAMLVLYHSKFLSRTKKNFSNTQNSVKFYKKVIQKLLHKSKQAGEERKKKKKD